MSVDVTAVLENRRREPETAGGDYAHWHLRRDGDDVLWLSLDKQGSSANTLDAGVLQELGSILDWLVDKPPRALVLRSLKRAGFCAGADIAQFSEYSAAQMEDLLRRGHDVLDRLQALSQPTVAVVHGHCLGGGLELALACDRRIGLKGSLQMGFPEVQLGLHPGLGGTFRLTGLIDPVVAMSMMLTGKSAHEGQTHERGLVDALVEERHVENAVAAAVAGRIGGQRQSLKDRALNTRAARRLAARKMRGETGKQAPSRHYPAPYRLIDLWCEHGGDRDAMQEAEITSFCRLLESETSRNLVRVYFLREELKQAASGDDDAVARVHVLGAGAMGGDIAAWCALRGCTVTLSDIDPQPIADAVASVPKLCRDQHRSAAETRDTLDRLVPDPQGEGVASADLVIEAVPEDEELKQKIYRQVEPRMKEGAILASNTSSIPLETLASFLDRPQRFLGTHFFNPVSKMPVVEVVSHDGVDPSVQQRAMTFAGAIAKLPVAVHSYPGFLVNRALTPYLLEAVALLDEGWDKERIDRAAIDFGMPVGPVELADQVGLDICLHVADVLEELLDKPMVAIPDWMRRKVEQGDLGKKSGRGFYAWEGGRAQKSGEAAERNGAGDDGLADRLLLPVLDACVECYREGVVEELDHLDAAVIFGTGFAPFRGGPMHYARSRGPQEIVATLESLASEHGERFRPDEGWNTL